MQWVSPAHRSPSSQRAAWTAEAGGEQTGAPRFFAAKTECGFSLNRLCGGGHPSALGKRGERSSLHLHGLPHPSV